MKLFLLLHVLLAFIPQLPVGLAVKCNTTSCGPEPFIPACPCYKNEKAPRVTCVYNKKDKKCEWDVLPCCSKGHYCATGGICRADGTCANNMDCVKPFNSYPLPDFVKKNCVYCIRCTDGKCGKVCAKTCSQLCPKQAPLSNCSACANFDNCLDCAAYCA